MFNVYLDDRRMGPYNAVHGDDNYAHRYEDWHDWVICRSVEQVQELLKLGLVNNLSLDHDLGYARPEGYDLCKWMGENDCWPKGEITIHSANTVGIGNMKSYVDRYFYKIDPNRE